MSLISYLACISIAGCLWFYLLLCSGCILWLRVLCLLVYDDPYVYKSSSAGCLCYAVCVVSLLLMYKAPKGLISCLDYWVSLATGWHNYNVGIFCLLSMRCPLSSYLSFISIPGCPWCSSALYPFMYTLYMPLLCCQVCMPYMCCLYYALWILCMIFHDPGIVHIYSISGCF